MMYEPLINNRSLDSLGLQSFVLFWATGLGLLTTTIN